MITLQELLTNRGLDMKCRIKLVRHKDNNQDLEAMYKYDKALFFKYQETQKKDVFNSVDYIVSFLGYDNAVAMFIGVFKVLGKEPTFFSCIAEGAKQTISFSRLVFISLYDLFTGQIGFSDLSGPIGTVKVVADSTSYGLESVLFIIAFISINIGVFNLLPIPALDGGRLFILLIQAFTRNKIKIKHEAVINTVGLVVLLALIAVISANDIWNIIKGIR